MLKSSLESHLSDNIGKVQDVTEEVFEGVEVVVVEGLFDIPHQSLATILAFINVQSATWNQIRIVQRQVSFSMLSVSNL